MKNLHFALFATSDSVANAAAVYQSAPEITPLSNRGKKSYTILGFSENYKSITNVHSNGVYTSSLCVSLNLISNADFQNRMTAELWVPVLNNLN